jgi:hypothetical protein
MSATEIMALAMLLAVIGRWSHNQQAIPGAKGLVEIVFALLVIAFLDQGRTEPIAKGFAWIFLAAVVLSDNSPITGLAKISNATATAKSAGTGAAAGGAAGATK